MEDSSGISKGSEHISPEVAQLAEVVSQLRRGAEGIHKLSAELVQQLDRVREKILTLSGGGAGDRELKEQILVLESERDLLARQLGKVRREADDELSVAREKIRSLEVELSLSGGASSGGSSAAAEVASPKRPSAPPSAEVFEIEDDAPTEKRPSFAPDGDDIDDTTGKMSADLVESLLQEREGELPRQGSPERSTGPGDIGGEDIRGSSVGGVLEDLLSTYLDEK